jgi:hypothetical protein
MSVFHSNTEMLIDYWRGRLFGAAAPPRGLIDPADFAPLAPQAFVLGRLRAGDYPIRLAGEAVRDLFGADLRGRPFLSLMRRKDAWALRTALEAARLMPEPMVLRARGLADGAEIDLEILFAPLSGGDGGPDRFLGLVQPLAPVRRLQEHPVVELALLSLSSAGPSGASAPRVRLAAVDGLRIA